MKINHFLLLFFLNVSIAFANSADPVTDGPGYKARLTTTTNSSGVFFEDFSSGTIFIDFEGVESPLLSISILRGDQTLFVDPVSDLPLNTIYELNTELIRPGMYNLVLETVNGEKIFNHIRVE